MSARTVVRRRASIFAFALIFIAATIVYAQRGPASHQAAGRAGPVLAAGDGAITIGNSRQGRAIFSARDLLPGQSRQGSVTISNPNRQPLDLSLATRIATGHDLARAIEAELRSPGRGSLYSGSLAGMPKLPLGELAPGSSDEFTLTARLPARAGNELQGKTGSFDLIWSAAAAGPPPRCRLRAMRSRFFVFRGRNRIRLVARYRAAVPARVRVVFFKRLRGGAIGRRVGTLDARFRRHRHRWGMIRVAHRRPVGEMRRFRRSRNGYVAQLRVAGAPGYCRQYLNLDLVQLKRFYGQYVWFQRGSFRTLTARKR